MNKQLKVTLKWQPDDNGIIKLSFGDKYLEISAKLNKENLPWLSLSTDNINIESLKTEILFLFDESSSDKYQIGETSND